MFSATGLDRADAALQNRIVYFFIRMKRWNDSVGGSSGAAPSALALTPLLLFLALFFGAGLYFTAHGEAMGFYQLRAPVAILPALALAAFIAWRRGLKPLETLLRAWATTMWC